MNEYKLIVAGGRDFNDAALLERVLIAMADTEFADKQVSIVSGMARGADALAYQFAHKNGITCYEFFANWNKYGKKAGFMRNEEMGIAADGLLAFWDGESRGTKHMIDFMVKLNKPVTVIEYSTSE